MASNRLIPTADDIGAALTRIASRVRRTPVLHLAPDDIAANGAEIILKLEYLQHAGSFKSRGAFNNLLAREVPAAGLAAASGGNHGAALAYAASQLGHAARVFVPETASPAKIAAIKSYGAELVVTGARYADALNACTAFIAETGALSVHAYDAFETIAGQGTVATEWDSQSADLDTVLVAVGGGGLIAGMAGWWRGRVKVVGVEPHGAPTLHAALANKSPIDVEVNSIAADSLGAKRCGELVFEIARTHIDRVVLVEDSAILAAQQMLWRNFHMATEPGGAAALAALTSGAYRPDPGERVGVLMCGANVDLTTLTTSAT